MRGKRSYSPQVLRKLRLPLRENMTDCHSYAAVLVVFVSGNLGGSGLGTTNAF